MRNLDGITKIKAIKTKPTAKVKTRPMGEVCRLEFLAPAQLENQHIPARHPSATACLAHAGRVCLKPQATTGGTYRIKQKIYQKIKAGLEIAIKKFAQLLAEIKRFNSLKKAVPVYAIIVALALAFGGGAWAALNTQTTEAESVEQTQAGSVPLETAGNLGPISNVSNDVLFNMTIGQLEEYLNSLAVQNQQLKAAERMATRKEKLRAYLTSKKTPFVEAADIIAEQKHWKLILAISFAESTFGRNCVDNNCSNIGVKPGHPYWRKYATLGDWVKDFNRLMERRYSNWTLEQMNGVYVQPKNPNWLLATRQVLEELQEQGIE